MLSLPLALAQSCLLAASATADVDLSVRNEVRARSNTPGAQENVLGDDEVDPAAQLTLGLGATHLAASYSPRLVLHDPASHQPLELLHRARASGEWETEGHSVRLLAVQELAYGTLQITPATSFVFAQPGGPTTGPTPGPSPSQLPTQPTLEALPQVTSIRFINSSTSLIFGLQSSLRTRWDATVSYFRNGGLDSAAQQVLPLQTGPRAELDFAYSATRLDHLTTVASAWRTVFGTVPSTTSPSAENPSGTTTTTGGPSNWVYDLSQGIRHRFSRETEGQLSAGAAGVRITTPTEGTTWHLMPKESASLIHTFPFREEHLELALSNLLGPYIDRLTGGVYDRLEANASATFSIATTFSIGAHGGASWGVSPGPHRGDRLTSASLELQYRLGPVLQIESGLRSTWQTLPSQGVSGQFLWVAFAAVSIQERMHL